MICSTNQSDYPSNLKIAIAHLLIDFKPNFDVSLSSPGIENKFAPLDIDDLLHVSDFSFDVQRLFQADESNEKKKKTRASG